MQAASTIAYPAICAAMCAAICAATVLAGCATAPPPQMQLPDGLAARTEAVAMQGLGGGRAGSFELGADRISFERSATRLMVFDAALSRDSGTARYTRRRADDSSVQAECRAGQSGAQRSGMALALQAWRVSCTWSDGARLQLQDRSGGTGMAQELREGVRRPRLVLELRSEHRMQGSNWALMQPVGYVLLHEGRPVAAVDLNDSTKPMLWRPTAGHPARDAATQAALALALLWEPPR